jgi:hypothetical protein
MELLCKLLGARDIKENGIRQIAENRNRSANISIYTTLEAAMILRIQHSINHIPIALFI